MLSRLFVYTAAAGVPFATDPALADTIDSSSAMVDSGDPTGDVDRPIGTDARHRVFAELGASVGGAAGTVGLGLSLSFGLEARCRRRDATGARDCSRQLVPPMVLGAAAWPFVASGLVSWTGDSLGGHGTYGWTLLGAWGGILTGGTAAALIWKAGNFRSPALWATGGVVFFTTAFAGPVLGYELSSSRNEPAAAPPVRNLGWALIPLRGGAVVTSGARF